MLHMDKQTFLLLVEKILNGTATPEEIALYNQYYNHFQSIQGEWNEEELGNRDEIEGQLLQRIDRIRRQEETPGRKALLYRMRQIGAAAAILVLLGGVWWVQEHHHPRITTPAIARASDDSVRPGGNRAVLTLANGKKVVLDDAGKGMIAQQGNTRVVKVEDGRLAYHAAKEEGAVVMNTLSTPIGGQYQVALPDGTTVWLNSGSTLRFPSSFTGGRRSVELSGEAYFEVAGSPSAPFTVRVGTMEVQVLGTHFNIMGYAEEEAIETSLLTGSVRIEAGGRKALLVPGQQSKWKKDGQLSVADHADMEEAVAWKNGLFDFEAADMKTVMRQLSRWYNVEVVYEGQIHQHFTGKINRDVDISKVLQMLGMTEKVRFQVAGRKITVSPM